MPRGALDSDRSLSNVIVLTTAGTSFGGADPMAEIYLHPTPELPDDTEIEQVRLSTRIRNALGEAGLTTVGEVREASDEVLLSLQNLGRGSVRYLRRTLGPSNEA